MPPTPLEPGDPVRLGRFELLARLGEGGQGVVYLGRGTGPGEERVAVKVLRSTFDATLLERLARELDAIHQVQPFVTARVIEASADGGRRFVVSEFINGPSLEERVRAGGPLPEGDLQRLAVGTATALTAIHSAGVVHRDFKPANVVLGPDGPRVVDFGIARLTDAASITSGIIGTPAYMAPEQLAGARATGAVDIFAWAATIIFAATGRLAFGADEVPAVMHRIIYGEPDVSGVPPSLLPVVWRCLEKDPHRRPSARDLLLRLVDPPEQRYPATHTESAFRAHRLPLAGESTVSGPGSARLSRPGTASVRSPRGPILAVGGAVIAVLGAIAITIAIIAASRPSSSQPPSASPPANSPYHEGSSSGVSSPDSSGVPSPASAVIAHIAVGTGPAFAAVDSSLHRLYVTNSGNFGDTVSVVNTETDQVIGTVTVGTGPAGVAVDPRSHDVYVADFGTGGTGDTVSVIDGLTDQVTGTITVGAGPRGVAVDPVTGLVYVTDSGGDGGTFATGGPGSTVSVISARTNAVVGSITVGVGPGSVAVNAATNTIYVADADNGNGDTVSVIDGRTGHLTDTITVGAGPGDIAVDPATGAVFTANTGTGCPGPTCGTTVTVIDGRTGKVTATVAVGTGPDALAVNSSGRVLYVANNVDGTMSLINVDTGRVSGVVDVGSSPAGIAVDPSTGTVYVTDDYGVNDGTVQVVSGS